MPETLTTVQQKALDMLDSLPAWYESAPIALEILDAIGRELQRVEDFLVALRLGFFPQNADDTYGLLSAWESMTGLAVQPPGATLDQRQALVIARLRQRTAGSGLAWEDAVAQTFGGVTWTYQEGPGSYQITIVYPFTTGGVSSAQVQSLVRAVTPAHLQILATFTTGFLVGVSLVGDPL